MPERPPSFRPKRPSKQRPKGHNAKYLTPTWKALRLAVLTRDCWRCQICRKIVSGRDAQCDHIRAVQDGGEDTMENCQTLCAACHARKFWHEHHARK